MLNKAGDNQQIALQLQVPEFQTEELKAFRKALAADMVRRPES